MSDGPVWPTATPNVKIGGLNVREPNDEVAKGGRPAKPEARRSHFALEQALRPADEGNGSKRVRTTKLVAEVAEADVEEAVSATAFQ